MEGGARSAELPPARLCSIKQPAFIPKNGGPARNTSGRLYRASNCLTAIILGGLTRLHGCSLRIPLQLKNSAHGPLRMGPSGLPPSRLSCAPRRGGGGRWGGLWRGFWQGSQPCPGRQKDTVAKGTASFALRGGWAPPDEDPLDQNSVGRAGMRKKTEGRRKQ